MCPLRIDSENFILAFHQTFWVIVDDEPTIAAQ